MNEERLTARSLLKFLTVVKLKVRTKDKRGIYAGRNERTQLTSKASDIPRTMVSATIRRDCTECLRSPSTYSRCCTSSLSSRAKKGLALGLDASLNSRVDRPQRGSSSFARASTSPVKSGHLADASAASSPDVNEVPGRSGASTTFTSASCFPLSKGRSSMVRSITAEVDPWGRAGLSSVGATACTLGGSTTTPRQ
jgi:hypothetical protein